MAARHTRCNGNGWKYTLPWLQWVFLQQQRLDDEDCWQRYKEGPPWGADGAYLSSMVWLVVLTFVYARRTCRLLGHRFASEHKARRKKLTVARGTRSAFGLVQVLVVLLFYICGMGTGSPTGHYCGGGSGLSDSPDFDRGATHLTKRHEELCPSTNIEHTARIGRGAFQRFKFDCWRRSILAPQYFDTADRVRTGISGGRLDSRDDSDSTRSRTSVDFPRRL